MDKKYFKVAGITFEIRSEYPFTDRTFHHRLRAFEVKAPGPDLIRIEHVFSIPEEFKNLDEMDAFSKSPAWTVFRTDNKWIYKKTAVPVSCTTSAFFELSMDFRQARVYSDCITEKDFGDGNYTSLTLFACDQVLITRLLNQRQGALLHSNGFLFGKAGCLLSGPSNVGKTTLSRMLEDRGHSIVSDDRTIVTLTENQIQMHGSWLHGTTPRTHRGTYVLNAMFFLEQDQKNVIIPITNTNQKIGRILQAVVRPHSPKKEWEELLRNIEAMVKTVPCYRLLFDLSGDIVDVIARMKVDKA